MCVYAWVGVCVCARVYEQIRGCHTASERVAGSTCTASNLPHGLRAGSRQHMHCVQLGWIRWCRCNVVTT